MNATTFAVSELVDQQRESGNPWLEFLDLPSLSMGVYTIPAGTNDRESHEPHDRDEVYIGISGKGRLTVDGAVCDVAANSLIFVKAGIKHHFHDITDDLAVSYSSLARSNEELRMTKVRNLAILLFNDAEVLDFCGPLEVFSVASEQADSPVFNVYTVAEESPIAARNGLSVNPDHALGASPEPSILVVPGGIGARTELHNEVLIDWIRRTAANADLVLSVCTGALLLGKAGLLDGLEATTHHVAYDLLRKIVPTCTVYEDRRFVDNGAVITSAGIAAGIDMSLHVVERLLGSEVAMATAIEMEYPWGKTHN